MCVPSEGNIDMFVCNIMVICLLMTLHVCMDVGKDSVWLVILLVLFLGKQNVNILAVCLSHAIRVH